MCSIILQFACQQWSPNIVAIGRPVRRIGGKKFNGEGLRGGPALSVVRSRIPEGSTVMGGQQISFRRIDVSLRLKKKKKKVARNSFWVLLVITQKKNDNRACSYVILLVCVMHGALRSQNYWEFTIWIGVFKNLTFDILRTILYTRNGNPRDPSKSGLPKSQHRLSRQRCKGLR